jgi:hypothetical protein
MRVKPSSGVRVGKMWRLPVTGVLAVLPVLDEQLLHARPLIRQTVKASPP